MTKKVPLEILNRLKDTMPIDVDKYQQENEFRIFDDLQTIYYFYVDNYLNHQESIRLLEFSIEFCQNYPQLSTRYSPEVLTHLHQRYHSYLSSLPTAGCILINQSFDSFLMIIPATKDNTLSFGFPKGKLNAHENPLEGALRETFEETGIDCYPYLPSDPTKYSIKNSKRNLTLFVIPGVSDTKDLDPKFPGEVSKIEWVPHSYFSTPGSYPPHQYLQAWIKFVLYFLIVLFQSCTDSIVNTGNGT